MFNEEFYNKYHDYIMETIPELTKRAEPSWHEEKTSQFMIDELERFGYKVETKVNNTFGLVGTLDSGKLGPNVGLRADMDALTYEVNGEVEYRHACGHDGHITNVLALAQAVAEVGISRGKLVIIGQPAEETLNGAPSIIQSGLLDDLTHILGMHIRPIQDCSFGEAAAGIKHSAASPTKILVKGKTGHAARPHLGKNAVEAAVMITNAINQIKVNPNISHSAKVTQIKTAAGSGNIIPDEVNIYVDIRSQNNEVMGELVEKVKLAIEHGSLANGCEAEIDMVTCPAAEYDQEVHQLLEEAIKEEMGKEALIPDIQNSGSDDFHHYAQELPNVKAGFIGMGADASPGLHDVNMTYNHEAIFNGFKVMLNVINKLLIR